MNSLSSSARRTLPESLQTVLSLARLLQRLEASREPVSADQYRSVVVHLDDALQQAPAGDVLDAILAASPAAADVYENLNYAQAGLCRTPLDVSMRAELAAREALARAARPAPSRA